jgi:uncharacterized protein (DUF1684 family)
VEGVTTFTRIWGTAFLALAAIVPLVAAPAPDADYAAQVERARRWREQQLTLPDGWLSLVGLYFLEPGANTLGSAQDNKIVLPRGPAHLGTVTLNDQGETRVSLNPAAGARIDDREALGGRLIPEGRRAPTRVTCESLTFYVIERGGKMALRVKDSEAERRTKFAGIEYFPIDPSWRIEAEWVPFAREREVKIQNILGQEEAALVPGKAVFTREGRTFELLPLIEGGDQPLMFVISDATSGDETYEAARFVFAEPPQRGKLVLDFNLSRNPPCAFTPFATCPLPPKENRLPIAVRAGEKKYRGGHE